MSGNAGQMALFGQRLDVFLLMKSAMRQALKDSGLSREQIVDKLNMLLESEGIAYKVTPTILGKWVAPSARNEITTRLLPFFCRAVNSTKPIEIWAEALGLKLIGPREQHLIELGEAQLESRKASTKRRRAMEALEEMRL
jgi:hypothetical protein